MCNDVRLFANILYPLCELNNLVKLVRFKGAVAATYKAINGTQNLPALEPVGASGLAQRRGMLRPKSSTEV